MVEYLINLAWLIAGISLGVFLEIRKGWHPIVATLVSSSVLFFGFGILGCAFGIDVVIFGSKRTIKSEHYTEWWLVGGMALLGAAITTLIVKRKRKESASEDT
jgi:hypothetical protein